MLIKTAICEEPKRCIKCGMYHGPDVECEEETECKDDKVVDSNTVDKGASDEK